MHRSRLLLLVLAALLSVAVLATAWVVDAARREERRLEEAARANTEKILSRVDGELLRHISVLEALAASPLIDAGDLDRFRTLAARAMVQRPFWANVILAAPDGKQIFNMRFPPGRISARDSFASVLETGKPSVSGVSTGGPSGVTTVVVRAPVVRDGAVRAVLTAVLDPDQLAKMLLGTLPPKWIGLIIDREGRLIVRSTDGAAAIGQEASPATRAALASDLAGQVRQGMAPDGDRVMVMYLRSPLSGWTVHATIPFAALSILQTNSFLIVLGLSVASVILAAILSLLIVREARRERRHQEALAESERFEAIGQIAGGVAHDFNNLLMIIQATAHMIKRRGAQPDAVAPLADSILGATQRGAALTRQLLSYGRRGRYAPVSFRLSDLADNLATLLNQSTRGDIRIGLEIPADLWPILADPTALELALINLATNARDAMPEGGRLTVSAANATLRGGAEEGGLKGDYVALAVADTGAGIAAADLSRIFEPFFTTKPRGQGTGLGLSQVYGFARQSGGAVTVRSTPGEGSVFTLYLPRSRAPVVARPAEAAPGGRRRGRLLLVEDNDDVAAAVQAMLAGAGYDVARAASGAEALERIERQGPFDGVLSDIVMPGAISGLELEARLRRSHPDLPVVLMTGYSETLGRDPALGRTVLSKPFTEAELLAALKPVMPRRAGARPSAEDDARV